MPRLSIASCISMEIAHASKTSMFARFMDVSIATANFQEQKHFNTERLIPMIMFTQIRLNFCISFI